MTSKTIRVAILGLFAVSLAACATAPAQRDLTPPSPARADAKTSLESGRSYR
jgi:hypothetical protein